MVWEWRYGPLDGIRWDSNAPFFWVGIIGLVVWGVATLTKHYSPGSGSMEKRDAMAIAKERYARGEIIKEQFDQIKRDLS